MKKLLLTIILLATFISIGLRAGVVLLVGGGAQIGPMQTTNFTSYVQVGSFTLNPQYLYLSQNGLSNSSAVFVNGYISLDGTNRLPLSQFYQFTTNSAVTSALFAVTNVTVPVYGMLSVSNGTPTTITNFVAQLQF